MSDIRELEQAQIEHANGGTAPTVEKWEPVARVKATDAEVDALVEGAEAELEGAKAVEATPVGLGDETLVLKNTKTKVVRVKKSTAKKKPKATVVKKPAGKKEKKVKKIDLARDIFASNPKQPRKVVIGKIMSKTGLSPVAAATYYQICKRES